MLFGLADLAGGVASRSTPVRLVVVYSQIAGLITIAILAPILGPNHPTVADLAWGGGAGLFGVVGILLLYDGLARGRIGVVSPPTAVVGVVAPASFGLATGEQLTPLGWLGLGLAIPAVGLIAAGGSDHRSELPLGGLWWGIGSGLALSGFLILISRPDAEAGQWPLVAARVASITALAIVVTIRHEWQPMARSARPLIVGAGVLDISANAAFVLAERAGPLSVVSVLAGLYPAATLIGARLILHERTTARQGLGLVLATVAVIALSVAG